MVSKIVIMYILVAVISFSTSVLYFQQEKESGYRFQIQKQTFDEIEWNNEVTRILPRGEDLGNEWYMLWSDASEEFIQGESPIVIKKIVEGEEILSTSYTYANKNNGKYQILIWKGSAMSDWVPKDAVENTFIQTDAKIERILDEENLNQNCVIGYYDYYGDEVKIKNDSLFAECAKNDFRVKVNAITRYNQEAIDNLVLVSNSVIDKI